jgi:plasmid stabilization system protein ParE
VTVEWTARARDELIDAAAFYDGRQAGLGDAFLAAALEVGKRIAEHPRAFPFAVEDMRRANFPKRWPYSLFFVVRPDRSIVIATLSQRQDLRRLRGRNPPKI